MSLDPPPDDGRRTLPSDRAFVVHFAPVSRPGLRFEGRVEHLASGRSAFFSSRAALLAFVADVLAATRRP
ncbi:MAG: hypothetical protein IT293_04395 [Deltaproteobacteria bacterium]|nr:hypothetical protein [Deltaproteobacteria bacterium]